MWLTKKPDAYFEQIWHREPGAGVMMINLIHDVDLLRHLCDVLEEFLPRRSAWTQPRRGTNRGTNLSETEPI
jgi:predicted dehydrogenase